MPRSLPRMTKTAWLESALEGKTVVLSFLDSVFMTWKRMR